MLALAKRKCCRNLGPDGTRAREFSQLKGLLQSQLCHLQCQKGQPRHGSWEWAHLGWSLCQQLEIKGTSCNLQGEGQGQQCHKVLNSCPMGYDSSRQSSRPSGGLESEAGNWGWSPVREQSWCSGLIRLRACSSRMNSRHHTLVLIPAPSGLMGPEPGQGCVYNWPGLGKAGVMREESEEESNRYPQSQYCHLYHSIPF